MYICIWKIHSSPIYNFHIRISLIDQIFETENQQNRNKTWPWNKFFCYSEIKITSFWLKNCPCNSFFCFRNLTRKNGLFYVYLDRFQLFFGHFWRKCIFVHDNSILSVFGVYCILPFEPNIHIQCMFVYFFKIKVIYVGVYPMTANPRPSHVELFFYFHEPTVIPRSTHGRPTAISWWIIFY